MGKEKHIYDKTVHVRVPDEIREELVRLSNKTGYTLNTLILNCIVLQFKELEENGAR